MNAEAQRAYDTDFFEWSQDQAQLLKSLRLAGTELPAGLDIDQIAEEIEDLGKAELHAVEGHIRNILVHLLKAVSKPESSSVGHWRAESANFYAELSQKYSRSMRQRIDINKLWRLSVRVARDALKEYDDELASGLPVLCPFTIDDLVSDDFDFDQARDVLRNQLMTSPAS